MSAPSTDRNTLLGLLAVRIDLITEQALAAATAEWQRDRSRSLAQVLMVGGHLREDEIALLEKLVETHLQRRGSGPQTPGVDTVAPLDDRASSPAGEAPPTRMPEGEHTLRAGEGPKASRYRIVRPHARGGLGEVFVAVDEELNREVALKEIQAKHADDTDSRSRFLLEAEVTGRLEHPGIVPVYGLGAYADGRPFYAMRFVKGDSLLHALQRFHADETLKGDAGKRTLELRGLLGRFVAVCNAIAYAHSKGIMHRDLKPDNVMLGNYGETLVVDWGLAKAVGTREEAESRATGVRLLGADSAAPFTQAGSILGTPAYMSPEQAAGQIAELGSASDVYSLGATLYHLLTGQAPFGGSALHELLERVRRGQFPPLRTIEPAVPVVLEAICLKAMAVKPQNRYATAKDLSEDIEHWLADEPVVAYREPLRLRLARWRRRHPALVTGTAALACTVLVALGVGSLLLSREQGRTLQEQKDKLAEQDKRALAQVNVLLNASPQTVPPILEGLELFREQLAPRLRAVLDQRKPAEQTERALRLWQQHRTRAALALLPGDPGQRNFLKERLLDEDVEPEEMLLIRDHLLAHKKELAEELWGKVGEGGKKDGGNFRALVALAALDPKDPRWRAAVKDVVGPLLAADPLHVGVWGKGLFPVKDSLMAPLAEVFRDRKRPTEGRMAASVLRDYAADQPGFLVDLLMDADTSQFPLLLPKLRVYGERAVALLHRELDRQPALDWQDRPLDPTWPSPAQKLGKEIEKAQGMVAERFALCQALPLGRWEAVAGELGKSGYRPVRFRPYAAGDTLLVAAVWVRDGRAWQMAQGLTAAHLKGQDGKWREKGYIPEDVAGWLRGTSQVYGVLWVKSAATGEKARLYVGASFAGYKTARDEGKDTGLIPRTIQAAVGPDGKVRYSGVWGKVAAQAARWNVNWDETEADYSELLNDLRRQPMDVALHRGSPQTAAEFLVTAEKAVDASPTDMTAVYHRGLAYFRFGSDRKALADLNRVVVKFPRFADGYRYRALVRARLGHGEGARADLAAVVKLGGLPRLLVYLDVILAAYQGEGRNGLKGLEAAAAAHAGDAGFLYDAACAGAVSARAAAHLQRVQSGAAVMAAWGGIPALLLPARLEQVAKTQREQARAATELSLDLLRRALAAGYDDFAHLAADDDLDALRGHPAFKAFASRGHLDRRYASVRHASTTRTAVAAHGLSVADHLRRCRAYAAQGYRPVALSVATMDDGRPVAASVWQRPVIGARQRDWLGQRRANAAVALLKLGHPEKAWPVFQHSAHPDTRTYALHRAGSFGVAVRSLLKRLEIEKNASARQALILALGEYTAERVPADLRQEWTGRLLEWYRDDPDPGIHAAVDWLLRHGKDGPLPRKLDWGQAKQLQQIDLASRGRQPPDKRRWYVNGQGQTMVLLGPGEFVMGSPVHEAGRYDSELPHRRRVDRRFALASKKVTVAQFKRFKKAHPEVKHFYTERYSPDADGPIIAVTWYEAAQYCNWLSEQEGIPEAQWCYPPLAEIEKCKTERKPLKLPANYLTRTGYRLPTEVEWEYACRAGAATSRFYGSSVEMLGQYAWYLQNAEDRAWPVGQKKPNGWGLFDMHGNTWDWCQEGYAVDQGGARGKAADEEDKREVIDALNRIWCGGSYFNPPSLVRCACRIFNSPYNRLDFVGLRVARTYR